MGEYVGAGEEGRLVGIADGPEGACDGAFVKYTITVLYENADWPR